MHNKKEYIISLEIAKHIAMLEKNDIGRGVRQYFIDYKQSHLESWQERTISDEVKSKVAYFIKGREVGQKVISAYYRAIYRKLKSKYYVPRYSEIPSVKFEEALSFVRELSNDDLIS